MMKLFSITLTSNRPELMTEFYERLGFSFEKNTVKNGGYFYRAQFNGMELVIYKSNDTRSLSSVRAAPKLQLSLVLFDLEKVLKSLSEIQFSPSMDPTEIDGAIHAIVIDPEGHSVELIQAVERVA